MKTVLFGVLAAISILMFQSANSEEGYVSVDDISIRFIDQGEGTPVVLVHGFTGSADGWKRSGMIDALVDAGYRAIALDTRGHGGSSKPHSPDEYGMEMVYDIGRILDHLELDQAHFIGYSMGSRLINKFRDLYPNRCRSIILGGYAWGRPSTLYTEEQIQGFMKRRGPLDGIDVAALAATRPMAHVWEMDIDAINRNTVPTLLLIGDQDNRLDLTKAMPRKMPKSELIVVPGTHLTTVSSQKFIDEAVAFIKSQKSRLGKN